MTLLPSSISGKLSELNFSQTQTEIMTITPSLAKEMLNLNFSTNRSISAPLVTRYSQLMKDGHWVVSDPICFSTGKRLVNGQHRLHAVIKADKDIPFLVVFGLPDDSYLGFDQGKHRGVANLLSISGGVNGKPVGNRHVSIYRSMVQGVVGFSGWGKELCGVNYVREGVETIQEGLYFVSENGGNIPSSVLAVVARAYYTQDLQKLSRFLELLRDPCIPCNQNETFARKLVSRLAEIPSKNRGGDLQGIRFAFTQTALVKFLREIGWAKGVYFTPTKESLFPCPLDAIIARQMKIDESSLRRFDQSKSHNSQIEISLSNEYSTLAHMAATALNMTLKEMYSNILIQLEKGRQYSRVEIETFILKLFPSLQYARVNKSKHVAVKAISSSLMPQVERGTWQEEFPHISIDRDFLRGIFFDVK